MFTRLRAKHFQSLEDVDIDLAPLTVIIGESDVGKSATLRALVSVIENRAGKEFVTHGHSVCAVQVDVDGHDIGWSKGKDTNLYFLDEANYTKVGKGVPEDVTAVFNLHEASLAGQFDRPFLIFDPGAVVSGMLGSLTNLDLLYESVRLANQDKVKLTASESTTTIQLQDAVLEEAALAAQIKTLKTKVDAVTELEAARVDAVTKADALSQLVSSFTQVTEQAAKYGELERVGKLKLVVLMLVAKLEAKEKAVELVQGLLEQREALQARFYSGEVPTLPRDSVTLLEALVNDLGVLWGHINKQKVLLDDLGKADGLIQRKTKLLAIEQKALAKDLKGLDMCPFSGGKFYEECKDRLQL